MRIILLALFSILAGSPFAESQSLIDSLTSSKLSQIILQDHIHPMDTAFTNPSVYKLKVFDTLSIDSSPFVLIAFTYDDRGFGNRTTRTLVCLHDVSTEQPREIGCFSLGSVGSGRLFKFGKEIMAELTTDYGAAGWGHTGYHLIRVWPDFQSEIFSTTLQDCAAMDDNPCQRSFIKLIPDGTGELSQIAVWQTNTRNSDQTNELLSRRDSVSCFQQEEHNGELRFKRIDGLPQDSLRSLFRSADVPVRYLGKLADSLLKGM